MSYFPFREAVQQGRGVLLPQGWVMLRQHSVEALLLALPDCWLQAGTARRCLLHSGDVSSSGVPAVPGSAAVPEEGQKAAVQFCAAASTAVAAHTAVPAARGRRWLQDCNSEQPSPEG